MTIPKELLRQIINENDFKSLKYIYSFLKDSFKDMLQEMLEAEMDVSMGYPKGEKGDTQIPKRYIRYRGKGNLSLCQRYVYPLYS